MRVWPLAILAIFALAYEPFRSGLTIANQSCELMADWERIGASVLNLRHLVAYGLFCLLGILALSVNRLAGVAIAVFGFSILIEIEQSFFSTGHCRLRDLIPNAIGIGAVAFAVALINRPAKVGRGGQTP